MKPLQCPILLLFVSCLILPYITWEFRCSELSSMGILPCAAVLSQRNCFFFRSSSSASETDVTLSWNPMMHSSGLLGTLIPSLSGAVCVISSPMLSFEELADTIDRFKVTAVFFFPTRLQAVLKDMQRTGKRLSSLRKIGVGGSMVTDALAQATFKAFPNLVTFCNLYGLTESCGCLCSPPSPGISYNNIGFPASGVQIKVKERQMVVHEISRKVSMTDGTGRICLCVYFAHHFTPAIPALCPPPS